MAKILCGAGASSGMKVLDNKFNYASPYTFTFTEDAKEGYVLVSYAKYNATSYSGSVTSTGNLTLTPVEEHYTSPTIYDTSRVWAYYKIENIKANDTIRIAVTGTDGSGGGTGMYWIVYA